MLGRNGTERLAILVTGATHGLGRNAIEYLKTQPVDLRATGRDLEQGRQILEQDIDFVAQDLTRLDDKSAKKLLKNIDIVWHCAALSSPWGRYDDFYQINVKAAEDLARYAKNLGVRAFVHISTPSLYFNFQHHSKIPETYRPKKFANYYAKTKMIAENKLNHINKSCDHFNLLFLRPRAIFGPYDRVLLPRIFNILEEREGVLPLPRGGETRLDVTYVKNVIHAMELATVKLLDDPTTVSGEAYNISNGSPIQLRILLSQVLRGLGEKFTIKPISYCLLHILAHILEFWGNFRNEEPLLTPYSVGSLNFDISLDLSKAEADLGYKPLYSIEQGIHETLEWLKK